MENGEEEVEQLLPPPHTYNTHTLDVLYIVQGLGTKMSRIWACPFNHKTNNFYMQMYHLVL